MVEGPDLKQYLDTGAEFTQVSRSQAQKVVRELVKNGQVAQERGQSYVDELLERSRKRTEGLVDTIRREVRTQLTSLGVATRDDLDHLEQRLAKRAERATAAKKTPTRKEGAAKTTAAAKKGTTAKPSAPESVI